MLRRRLLNKSKILVTFIPPQVLPAQAPVNIKSIRIALEALGHKSKSAVEYPVVEIILATWKEACLKVSSKVG